MQTFNFADKTQQSFYLALEHPVPLLPNVRIQHNPLEADGVSNINAGFSFAGATFVDATQVRNQVDLTSTDYVLYYEILDNDLISIDFGINGKYIDGLVAVEEVAADGMSAAQDVSQWLPMLYTSAAVGLPLTGLQVFANGRQISRQRRDAIVRLIAQHGQRFDATRLDVLLSDAHGLWPKLWADVVFVNLVGEVG